MDPVSGGEYFRLTIPSQTRYLNLVTGLAKRAALQAGMDEATAAKVSIAVDESVTNVIQHAYGQDPDRQVDVEFHFLGEALEVRILHDGRGLENGELVIPEPDEYLRHPRRGGLGLLLMSRFMDSLEFGTLEGRRVCRMVKRRVP
nr:ATP-binding protein [uncultured Holophaga sp.]